MKWTHSLDEDYCPQGNDGSVAVIESGEEGERVCVVDCKTHVKRGHKGKVACEVRDARVRLISAAPDLLEALQFILERGGSSSTEWCPREAIDKARAAIAKATGGKS